MHEEMNSISNMLSFRSSTNFVCTCFAGEICMNKILFKPIKTISLEGVISEGNFSMRNKTKK